MRVIAAGCEYSGVSSLLRGLMEWGRNRGVNFHLDDHFSIPDQLHPGPEDQQALVDMSAPLKERFQRLQLGYHVRVLRHYEHCLFSGFHIEEMVYGERYYYPGVATVDPMSYEPEIESDSILVQLHASPEIIRARMAADPHEYNLISAEEIPHLQAEFAELHRRSILSHKIEIDTSHLSPEQLLNTFFGRAEPHLAPRDLALLR